jgi:hypothetical protein
MIKQELYDLQEPFFQKKAEKNIEIAMYVIGVVALGYFVIRSIVTFY